MNGTQSRIVKRLEEEEAREGALPPILHFYRRLLVIQAETAGRLGKPGVPLDASEAKERLRQGMPLLTFDTLELDWALFAETFDRVAALFTEYPELFMRLPRLARGEQVSRDMVRACFEASGVPGIVEGDSGDLVQDLVQVALTPFLECHAAALGSLVQQDLWRRRYCPVCGGKPDISYLEKTQGARWLVCARCNTEWLFQRLECPHCGCADQYKLAFFTDDEGRYRLYVCEECRRYLKAVDLRQAGGEVLLPLERLLTVDIDAQAREHGYTA